MDFAMIIRIIFLIFENFCGSFRDTWFSDDFGIFPKVFRIRNWIPGIRHSNYFFLFFPRKYLPFSIFFSFFLFSFLPFPSTKFYQILHSSIIFSNLPPKYLLQNIFTSPISMAGHDWPRETPHPSTLQLNPSLFHFYITFTNPNPI